MRDAASPDPSFPPLLTGHRAPLGVSAWDHALAGAAAGDLAAGDLVWAADPLQLDIALVAEPDVTRHRCAEMALLGAVAFGDALGALAPPEVPITYRWPGDLLVNGAQVGAVRQALSPAEVGQVPDRLVLGITCAIVGSGIDPDGTPFDAIVPGSESGDTPQTTALWDEGCGDLTGLALIDSVSRHLVNWIHRHGEEGFAPVHKTWTGRQSPDDPLAEGIAGRLIGIDDTGAALIENDGVTTARQVPDLWPV